MVELKYLVVARLVAENITTPSATGLIGSRSVFYCGDSEEVARAIYDNLPNPDKKIMFAKVQKQIVNNKQLITSWSEINRL